MAKQDYSRYQQGIIKRYYENREQIDEQRLAELVTNLYLAPDKKKAKLWEQAQELMERMKVPKSRIEHVINSGDPTVLAEVVKDLQNGSL
jgi:hypothetical protein